ncbi:hypothetical protein BDP55DRAFT_626436 [Colletotrichum godetiae]|uniref:Uncharacterized protein n=1 Tax=Colletotrichum godetiae TaxID=1209918 RepID=A0AAJ0F3T2_9PEZI|nr:uncharacterized protein BDP55DRAFT_626436 [Colletotrichum godetiae]KAK1699735.1 hypothetical protein BDP55DRAFT_626436 [Colletotrichum godetiae]
MSSREPHRSRVDGWAWHTGSDPEQPRRTHPTSLSNRNAKRELEALSPIWTTFDVDVVASFSCNELGHNQAHRTCHHDSVLYRTDGTVTFIIYHKREDLCPALRQHGDVRSTVRYSRGYNAVSRLATEMRGTAVSPTPSLRPLTYILHTRWPGRPHLQATAFPASWSYPPLATAPHVIARLERHLREVTTPPAHRKTNRRVMLALTNRYSCRGVLIGEETSFDMWLLAECPYDGRLTTSGGNIQEFAYSGLSRKLATIPYASIARPAIS